MLNHAVSLSHRTVAPSEIKANGVHYTPLELADFLADATVRTLGKKNGIVRILDPACGNGGLLLAIAKAFPKRDRHRLSLAGFETNSTALEDAKRNLGPCEVPEVELGKLDFLSLRSVENGRRTRQFDVVIANPPYVRTQVLGAKKAQELARRFRLSGRVDLYQAFVRAMADVLKPGGVLGLLISNRFLMVKSGAALRRLLREELSLEAIYDLGDSKLFRAAVLPVIVVARKRPCPTGDACRFLRVYEQRAGTDC